MMKVSNITNNSDYRSINSRVFIGNLNTGVVTREELERIFSRYGKIFGLSVHKGYAFVQYANEQCARNAVANEFGRILAGQPLDCNMAGEPRPDRPKGKRTVAQMASDVYTRNGIFERLYDPLTLTPLELFDYHRDGYFERPLGPRVSPVAAAVPATIPPAAKRARRDFTPQRTITPFKRNNTVTTKTPTSPPVIASSAAPDILICGSCKEQFTDVDELQEHKKQSCVLKIVCRCGSKSSSEFPEPSEWLCNMCNEQFDSAWMLMRHSKAKHDVQIYVEKKSTVENEEKSEEDKDSMEEGGGERGEENGNGTEEPAENEIKMDADVKSEEQDEQVSQEEEEVLLADEVNEEETKESE